MGNRRDVPSHVIAAVRNWLEEERRVCPQCQASASALLPVFLETWLNAESGKPIDTSDEHTVAIIRCQVCQHESVLTHLEDHALI